MKKQLLFFTIVLLPAVIYAKEAVSSCQYKNLLFPKQTFLTASDKIDIISDRSEIIKQNTYKLDGNVSIKSDKYYIAADKIDVNEDKTIIVNNNVRMQDSNIMLTSDKGVIKKQNGTLHTVLENVNYHYPKSGINGKAQKIRSNDTEQIFDFASYSLCPLGKSDWQFKADKIILNSKTNTGYIEDATLEFFGVPVFYFPYYYWTLKGRGTGFLAPSFNSSSNSTNSEKTNYQVRIPYYFNIAPDRDFLFAFNTSSSYGNILEGKYRQLFKINNLNNGNNGNIEIEAHYLNKDKTSGEKRWLFASKLHIPLGAKANLNIAANRVSDKYYFKDIDYKNHSILQLKSNIDLNYEDKEKDFNMYLLNEYEQLVGDGSASYTRSPEIAVSKNIKLKDRNIKLGFTTTNFSHKNANTTTNKTAVRTHAEANFSRLVVADNYSLMSSLGLLATNYDINNNIKKNRNMYSFNVDAKLFLEKDISLFNTNIKQILIPRLMYSYRPARDQTDIPNFDSYYKNNSYNGLFSSRRFSGIDKISNANNFILGAESNFVNKKTEDSYLNLKVAQGFYLTNKLINNEGLLADHRKYSDIALDTEFKFNDFTFNGSLQYDPEVGKLSKSSHSMNYYVNSKKFLTLARNNDGNVKSGELYGAYPINKEFHVFAGINRSITNSITNKRIIGFAYNTCCWAFRLASFKEHSGNDNYYNSTKFELVFKGLTSTSPNLYNNLEENIPNYSASFDY